MIYTKFLKVQIEDIGNQNVHIYAALIRSKVLQGIVMLRCNLMFVIAMLTQKKIMQSTVEATGTSFWITVKPLSVEWTKDCLTAAGCIDSRLMLAEWNLVSDERISSSWSMHENFVSISL